MKFLHKALLWFFNWIRKDFQRPKPNAHDFFEEEWDDYDNGYPDSSFPSIQTLSCPQCHHRGSFKIQVKEFLLMFHDYLELDRSQQAEWGPGSPCECPDCRYQGAVLDFNQSASNKETAHG